MELSITFPPTADESPLGYYRRLAAENALWSWKELARMAGVSPSRTGLLSQPEYLAETLGLQSEWTHELAQREAVQRAWRGLHRHGHDAVCPTCLAESTYLKAAWEHAYAVACPKHGVLLVDQCPSCGDFLSHDRERIELCRCGHDLRCIETEGATQTQRWLASLLSTEGETSGGVEPHIAGADVSGLVLLVRTLCQQFDTAVAGPRRNTAAPRSVQDAINYLRPLEALLVDWPHRFEAHVAERIAAGSPEARTLNALLGRWYQQLKEAAASGPLQAFLKVVIEVAARDFNGVVDHPVAVELGLDSHLPVAEAAKHLGVSRDTLVQHLKAGKANYRTRRLGTRGLCYEMPQEEVHRLKEERDRWISIESAATHLGVGPSILARMGEAGLVVVDVNWRTDLIKGGAMLVESMATFEARARAHVKKAKTAESTIAIKELNSRRIGDKKAIEAVLRAIFSGELCAIAAGEKLGSLRYRVSEVKRYFGRPVLDAGLSVNQLAKLTGWKWESVRHWIDEGLLGSHEIVLRGQACKVVMPEQLLAFSQSYVPLSTLAHSLETTSSALLERLGGIQLLGGKRLPSGAVRGALVRLSDLAQAALLPGLRDKSGGA